MSEPRVAITEPAVEDRLGFWHPDLGYWETVGTPSGRVLDGYMDGTQNVPLRPHPHSVFLDGEWVDGPPVPVPDEAIYAEANARLRALAADYPAEERETWATQAAEAAAILADPASADATMAPFLARRALQRGWTLEEMATRVQALAVAFADASGAILAGRDALLAMPELPQDWNTNDAWWS
ncbi:hypothetical protein SAMN05443999_101264 [Roseovarius azorensis]|uniref:DUF4376 domain-containing protein n=1 Tax=Roseovarius azorensis TaxID=1287727 RepID=A0A1H7G9Z7_9RHOB|nr:hypothetical protein [Roseovarius azorensis]SEK35093.1 hypothetical protein SAMN05443999_101264 [Roseovarius azorensis]